MKTHYFYSTLKVLIQKNNAHDALHLITFN